MKLDNPDNLIPGPNQALPGRDVPVPVASSHYVNGNTLTPPFPSHMQKILFGMGCFWGAERKLWRTKGVFTTAAGYSGGHTPNPSYQEVCSGLTGHNEVVLVVFDPQETSVSQLLTLFWESHIPTQGMRQGNDIGTQYRSGVYTYSEQHYRLALESRTEYQTRLRSAGYGQITTEIKPATNFYYAEDYHQQYLAKVPTGYCAMGSTGVCYSEDE
jgi:peptide-methionine (S)-S-oxide reductase